MSLLGLETHQMGKILLHRFWWAILALASLNVFGNELGMPDVDATGAVTDGAVQNIYQVLQNMPDITAGLFTQLENIEGDTFESKSRNVMTALGCIKGDRKQKLETVQAIMDMAKKAKGAESNDALKAKMEVVKRYWDDLIKPMGGLDGIFNTGDTEALLSCISQQQLDEIAHNVIVTGAYPLIRREVDKRLPNGPIGRRIAARVISKVKGKAHGKYNGMKDSLREQIETEGRARADKFLKEVLHESGPVFKEPSCREKRTEGRTVNLHKAINFAQETTGFNFYWFAKQMIEAKYHHRAPPKPQLNIPIDISGTQLGVEFEFPQGVPVDLIESSLKSGKFPTKFIIGMKEETRTVNGKPTSVKRFSIEPQKLALGVTLRQMPYRNPDGSVFNMVTVSYVLPGSPAEKLGLKAGDPIISINGENMANKSIADVTSVLADQARTASGEIELVYGPKDARGKRVTTTTKLVLDHPCGKRDAGQPILAAPLQTIRKVLTHSP